MHTDRQGEKSNHHRHIPFDQPEGNERKSQEVRVQSMDISSKQTRHQIRIKKAMLSGLIGCFGTGEGLTTPFPGLRFRETLETRTLDNEDLFGLGNPAYET